MFQIVRLSCSFYFSFPSLLNIFQKLSIFLDNGHLSCNRFSWCVSIWRLRQLHQKRATSTNFQKSFQLQISKNFLNLSLFKENTIPIFMFFLKIRHLINLHYTSLNKWKNRHRHFSLIGTDHCYSMLYKIFSLKKTFLIFFQYFRKSAGKWKSKGHILERLRVSFPSSFLSVYYNRSSGFHYPVDWKIFTLFFKNIFHIKKLGE